VVLPSNRLTAAVAATGEEAIENGGQDV
jgi:hypothetical protein